MEESLIYRMMKFGWVAVCSLVITSVVIFILVAMYEVILPFRFFDWEAVCGKLFEWAFYIFLITLALFFLVARIENKKEYEKELLWRDRDKIGYEKKKTQAKRLYNRLDQVHHVLREAEIFFENDFIKSSLNISGPYDWFFSDEFGDCAQEARQEIARLEKKIKDAGFDEIGRDDTFSINRGFVMYSYTPPNRPDRFLSESDTKRIKMMKTKKNTLMVFTDFKYEI